MLDQLEHFIEMGAGSGDGIENRPAAGLAAVVNLEAALVEFDRRIVKRQRDIGDFLDRRDKVGQKIEHFLRANHHGLCAVDVDGEIIRAEVSLHLGQMLIALYIAVTERLGGAREGIVDQFAD